MGKEERIYQEGGSSQIGIHMDMKVLSMRKKVFNEQVAKNKTILYYLSV